MKVRAPMVVSIGGVSGRKNTLYIIGIAAAVVLIAAGGYLWYASGHNSNKKTGAFKVPAASGKQASTSQEETRYSQTIDKTLQSGDTVGYENAQLSLVYGYLLQNDFASAGRLLDDIQQKVAAKDLQPTYYMDRFQVDQHSGDGAAQKADLQALIPLLRAQHRDGEADAYQKQLDAL